MGIGDAKDFASSRGVAMLDREPLQAYFQRVVEVAERGGVDPEHSKAALEHLFAGRTNTAVTRRFGEALLSAVSCEAMQDHTVEPLGLADTPEPTNEAPAHDSDDGIDDEPARTDAVVAGLGASATHDVLKLSAQDKTTIPLFAAAGVDLSLAGDDPIGYLRRCVEAVGRSASGNLPAGYQQLLSYLSGNTWSMIARDKGTNQQNIRVSGLGFARKLERLELDAQQWHELASDETATVPADRFSKLSARPKRGSSSSANEVESHDVESPDLSMLAGAEESARQDEDFHEVLKGVHVTNDLVRDYMRMAGRTPLLNAEREVQLAQKIEAGVLAGEILQQHQDGDEDGVERIVERQGLSKMGVLRGLKHIAEQGTLAREEFTNANLRLVISIAARYQGRGMEFSDLIQEGNIGLLRAVEKYDYTKGYKFSTYATWWIKQALGRAISDKGRTIRVPIHADDGLRAYVVAKQTIAQETGNQASDAELAERLNIPLDKIKMLERTVRTVQNPVSIHTPLGDGESHGTLGDMIHDADEESAEEQVIRGDVARRIDAVLGTLSDKEADVVRRRMGLGGKRETLDAIAADYGVNRERIRQIEFKTMSKLRHPSRASALRGLLAAFR